MHGPWQRLMWNRRQGRAKARLPRSEEHTSELQSQSNLVCRLLLEKKNMKAVPCAEWPTLTPHTEYAIAAALNQDVADHLVHPGAYDAGAALRLHIQLLLQHDHLAR